MDFHFLQILRIDRYGWVYIFSFSRCFTHYFKIIIKNNHPVIPVEYTHHTSGLSICCLSFFGLFPHQKPPNSSTKNLTESQRFWSYSWTLCLEPHWMAGGQTQEIASLTQGIIIVPSQPSPPNVTLPRNNGLIRGIGWPAMILRDHGGLHILLKAGYPSVSSCGLGLVGNFPLGYFGCIPVIHCWFRFCVFLEAILERVMNSVWNHSLLIGPCRMYKLRNWSSSHLYMHRFFAPRLLLFLTLKPAHISTLQKGPGWCFPPTKESVVLSHYRGQYAWRSIVVEAFVGCGGPWRWDFQNPGGKE